VDFELYLGFVMAVSILVLVPGPLVALIVSNSVTYGSRFGLMTVLGAAAATVVHLLLVAAGMAAAVRALGPWFDVVRVAGGAYVVWIGLQAWLSAPADLTHTRAQPKTARATLLDGFLVALFNPKALLFYAAFFPQFVNPALPVMPQVTLLCATLLCLGMMCDSSWALLAGRLRQVLASHARLRNQVTGGMLMTVGVVLTMVHGA
jgi:homoserine/homoserine lactone efflux protein